MIVIFESEEEMKSKLDPTSSELFGSSPLGHAANYVAVKRENGTLEEVKNRYDVRRSVISSQELLQRIFPNDFISVKRLIDGK